MTTIFGFRIQSYNDLSPNYFSIRCSVKFPQTIADQWMSLLFSLIPPPPPPPPPHPTPKKYIFQAVSSNSDFDEINTAITICKINHEGVSGTCRVILWSVDFCWKVKYIPSFYCSISLHTIKMKKCEQKSVRKFMFYPLITKFCFEILISFSNALFLQPERIRNSIHLCGQMRISIKNVGINVKFTQKRST